MTDSPTTTPAELPAEGTTQISIEEVIAAYKARVSDLDHELLVSRVAVKQEQRVNAELRAELAAAREPATAPAAAPARKK